MLGSIVCTRSKLMSDTCRSHIAMLCHASALADFAVVSCSCSRSLNCLDIVGVTGADQADAVDEFLADWLLDKTA